MDNDFFNKLPQQGVGQFLKAGVLADNFHKLFRIDRGFLCLCKFRLQFGGTALDLFLLGFIVCGKFCKAFIRNTPGHAVLIKPLEDSRQFRNSLFGCVQFLSLGSVAAFATVLVLLDQQLHKLLFVLGCITCHFLQIGSHTRCQKVGADKVCSAIVGTLLVVAANVAILFSGFVLISLLIEDAPAIGAEQQAGEQTDFIIAVRTLALLA